MPTDNRIIPGIVKNGVVVPQANSELPDGAHVNIVLQPAEMPQELKEELEAWQPVLEKEASVWLFKRKFL